MKYTGNWIRKIEVAMIVSKIMKFSPNVVNELILGFFKSFYSAYTFCFSPKLYLINSRKQN